MVKLESSAHANNLVHRDAAAFLHQSGSTPVQHAFTRVEGIWAEDENGHRFMDFHGNSCHNIGYNHPYLLSALSEQLHNLSFTPRGFTNEPAVALAEKLAVMWPYDMCKGKVLFGLSGSDAIEIALKLAYVATGRKRTISFADSWHGAGLGAVWVGGRASEREPFPPLEGCCYAAPYWHTADTLSSESAADISLQSIRKLFEEVGGFASFIAEPIRSTPHIPPEWFWPEVRRLCDEHGTLLIFDEIPTGLGKTGRLFSSEHFEVTPDMTVLGKSLGGAILPISAVLAHHRLDVSAHLAIGHYTHQKNPLLCRAGLAVLEIISGENLVERAARMGEYALQQLHILVQKYPVLQKCTGVGLLMSLELSKQFVGKLAALKKKCYEKGLNIGTSEGTSLCLSPPLIIEKKEIELAISLIESAINECLSAP